MKTLFSSINGLNHHERRVPDTLGPNPLDYMASGRVQVRLLSPPKYYLYEWRAGTWQRYMDYQNAVQVLHLVSKTQINNLLQISQAVPTYGYCLPDGHRNAGA